MAYVEEALAVVEKTFFKADEVNWDPIREWAFKIVEGNPTREGAYEAVAFAMAALDTPHTGFVRPGEGREDQMTRRPPPSGERIGDVGYLDLSGITDPSLASEYAGQLRQVMEDLDSNDRVCGWILDLRESIGGSSIGDWLGLGPLVGDDQLMSFGKTSDTTLSVYYDNGTIRYEGTGGTAVHEERVPPDAYIPESLDVPVAVLISSRTASAGEAAAIPFVGRPDTRFFGEQTGGATIASEFYEMSDGAQLRVPSGFYQDRSGHDYEEGLEPDEYVLTIRGSDDHVLTAAVEWTATRQACR